MDKMKRSNVWRWLSVLSIHLLFLAPAHGAEMRKMAFKKIGDVVLHLHVFDSGGARDFPDAAERSPASSPPVAKTDRIAILFFFGGGWVKGKPTQFYPYCRHFAGKGAVAISAEYRLAGNGGTTPRDSVEDAKSAVRWLRIHAGELGIAPNRIVAGGTSAGAHLAACAAMIEGMEGSGEERSVSSRPDALVLLSPVLDTTRTGYDGLRAFGVNPRGLSPVHHVRRNLPPTLILHGTADATVDPENSRRFGRFMEKAGNVCEVLFFRDAGHGLFHEQFEPAVAAIERFLDVFSDGKAGMSVSEN